MNCPSIVFVGLLLYCVCIIGPERVLAHDSEAVALGEFPSAAAVLMEIGGTYKPICGGVLIAPNFLLSAASCFEGDTEKTKPFKVLLGAVDITSTAAPAELVTGKKITRHPTYEKDVYKFDIAILELEKEVVFTDQIKAVNLARADDEMTHLDCTGVGWGVTSLGGANGPWNVALQKITLNVQSRDKCEKSFGKPDYTTLSTTCTVDPATKVQHCTVDRGGGLYCLERFKKTPFILAIASDDLGSCTTPERITLFSRVSFRSTVAFITATLPAGSIVFLDLDKEMKSESIPPPAETTTHSGTAPLFPLPLLSAINVLSQFNFCLSFLLTSYFINY